MNRRLSALACVLWVLAVGPAPPALSQEQPALAEAVRSSTRFAIDLYRQLGSQEGNLFFSPHSIYAVLALAYAGASGETAAQMAELLHVALEDEQMHPAMAQLQSRLREIPKGGKVELRVASSLWPADGHPFLPAYLELARTYYGAEITPVDYRRDPEGARRQIDAWVARETQNLIRQIIPGPGFLQPLTRLALVNAIYFNGQWQREFRKSATAPAPFRLSEAATVQVPMMRQEGHFRYGRDELVQVLEMPYVGGDLSMLIVLPTQDHGLGGVEQALSAESLERWIRVSEERLVDVSVPRFEITYDVDLTDVLRAMGMTDAFDEGKADFSGMDGGRIEPVIYLYSALHKAFVDVDERGTKAAAVTAAFGCFPEGTAVCADTGLRPIETVKPGSFVHACDLTDGRWVLARVLERLSCTYQGDMITVHLGDESIECTGNQPFYVLRGRGLSERPVPREVAPTQQAAAGQGRWVEARDLEAGDVLHSRNRGGVTVGGLSRRHETTRVYWLEIEGLHNCAVHRLGVIAHNGGGKQSARPVPVPFRADHPFLFLIRDTVTASVLFVGRVANPAGN